MHNFGICPHRLNRDRNCQLLTIAIGDHTTTALIGCGPQRTQIPLQTQTIRIDDLDPAGTSDQTDESEQDKGNHSHKPPLRHAVIWLFGFTFHTHGWLMIFSFSGDGRAICNLLLAMSLTRECSARAFCSNNR